MTSRLKRIVSKQSREDKSERNSLNKSETAFASVLYEEVPPGKKPLNGTYPLTGNAEPPVQQSQTSHGSHLPDSKRQSRIRSAQGPSNLRPPQTGPTHNHESPPSALTTDSEEWHESHQTQPALDSQARNVASRRPEPLDPQDVIRRAQHNSEDIGVAVTTAMPVTHETVIREIHHVREEEITREVHNYDVFHRILPIVDVEVLPARHFLPGESGGLVEVDAEDVPARGRHWVVAETLSQIPSGQVARTKGRSFSAREFKDGEGDALRYYAPEGHLVTEQTWVHPPELETGGRDSGQTWPLAMDKLSIHDRD